MAAVQVPNWMKAAAVGERAAAVLRMQPGHGLLPTLDEVRAHFEASGVARQKWPEYLHEVDEFPRTLGGKVQKFKVRELARGIATMIV